MAQPLVSFLITAYNEEEYVCECIQSCLGQTHPNVEVVITDDGSTDNTYQVIQNNFGHDDRVKLYRHARNRGKIHGFNTSYAHAEGEYIAVIGADDINYPERISTQLPVLERTGACFVASDLDKVDKDGKLSSPRIVASRFGLDNDCGLTFDDLVTQVKAYGATMFFRKSVSDQLFPLDSKLPQESWWLPAMLTYYGRGYYVAKSLVGYRIHPGNTTQRPGIDHFLYMATRNEGYYHMLLQFIEQEQLLKKEIITDRTLNYIQCELCRIQMIKTNSLKKKVEILIDLPKVCARGSILRWLLRLAPLRVYYGVLKTIVKLKLVGDI